MKRKDKAVSASVKGHRPTIRVPVSESKALSGPPRGLPESGGVGGQMGWPGRTVGRGSWTRWSDGVVRRGGRTGCQTGNLAWSDGTVGQGRKQDFSQAELSWLLIRLVDPERFKRHHPQSHNLIQISEINRINCKSGYSGHNEHNGLPKDCKSANRPV